MSETNDKKKLLGPKASKAMRQRERRFPLTQGARVRLEEALCTIVDLGWLIGPALLDAPGVNGSPRDAANVCRAIRALIDEGWEPNPEKEYE